VPLRLDRPADAEIPGRQHIRPVQIVDQEGLGRPRPDAAHRSQRGDGVRVAEGVEVLDVDRPRRLSFGES
jgi:hypothetical protein